MGMLLDLVTGAAQTGQKILADDREREGKLADRKAELDYTNDLAMKREVAVAALKAQMEEAAAQRDARTKIAADEQGAKTLEEAQFQKFKRDLGQSDASDEELRKVFADQYFDRSVAPGDANSDRFNPRDSEFMRSGRDAALKMGASSGLLKQYDTELKDQRGAERLADDNLRKDRLEQYRWEKDREDRAIAQQRADAATTTAAAAIARAERGGSGGGSGGGRITVRRVMEGSDGGMVAVMSDGSTKDLGMKSSAYNKSISRLISDREKNDPRFSRLDESEKQAWAEDRLSLGGAKTETPQGRNTDTKSKPTVSLPPVDRLSAGKVTTFANGERWTLGTDGKPKKVN